MLTDLTGHQREVLPFLLKTNFHRRAHCWGQGGLDSGKRIGGAGGSCPASGLSGRHPHDASGLCCPLPAPQILSCLLTEQRVVFFSSSWALLTLVAECFMAYLHPLQWQHTFVPILSGQMLDFLMAPTSFLMGCHLDHFEEVSKVSTCCWIQGAESRDFERTHGELLGGEGGRRGLGRLQHRAPARPPCPRGVLRARALSVTPDTVSQVCREVRADVRVEVSSAAY